MNKMKDFTKKYGFYLAVGFISVGAITAVIVTSTQNDNVVEQTANPYVEDEENVDRLLDEVNPEDSSSVIGVYDKEDALTPDESLEPTEEPEVAANEEDQDQVTVEVEDQITSETFNSTTADGQEAPFFVEGDTLLLPVEGKLTVPYTDDTTKHWYSQSLEQTMRTYGITVSAEEGESIKAPATAKIVDITEDSSALENTRYVGDVGKVIVMDLGNGYTCQIGVQGGTVDEDLLGQVVLAGQEIATAGNGTGPFAGTEGSVYIQLQHEGQLIDPTEMFSFNE